MSDQENPNPNPTNTDDEVVPVPPKGSSSGSKVLLIVVGVLIVGAILLSVVATAGYKYFQKRIGKEILKTQGIDVKKVDEKSGEVEYSIKGDEGEELTFKSSKTLPDDFPTNQLPIYDGEITNTNRMVMEGRTSWTIIITTSDSIDAVKSAVRDNFISHDWEIVMEQDTDESGMLIAKKDGYTATTSYSIDSDNGEVRISYNVREANDDDD